MKVKMMVQVAAVSLLMVVQLGAAPAKGSGTKIDFIVDQSVSLDDAVLKILPKGSELIHPVTMGVYGPRNEAKGENVTVIYKVKSGSPEVMILFPVQSGKYRILGTSKLNFGKKNAGDVYAVFFSQADKDDDRELFILCDVEGSYQTAVFDWSGKVIKRMPSVEKKITGIYPSISVKRALKESMAEKGAKKKK